MKLFNRISPFLVPVALTLMLSTGTSTTVAAQIISFKGKPITILVGSKTGGSTDLVARTIAPFLTKYLPGNPTCIVQNMPGGQDIIAMNYFAQKAKPDGTTTIVGSSSQFDPLNYRVPQSRYDPTTFIMVGGMNIGGTAMIIRNEALPRLTDMGASPVNMGTVGSYPHVGMLMTAWGIKYLGWHAKWVSGYSNDTDLALALERGEIDMTSLANVWFHQRPALQDKSKFTITYQTGSDGGTKPSTLPALAKTPVFTNAMKGKITDPLAIEAYDYWRNLSYVFKWIALPPKTPKAIVETYRAALQKAITNPDFVAQGQKINPGFSAIPPQDLTIAVDDLAKVPPKAMNYMTQLLRQQGLNVEMATKKKKKKE